MSAGCDRRWNCTRVLQHHAIDLCANQLAVLRTATEFHKRSFHVAAPVISVFRNICARPPRLKVSFGAA